MGQKDRGLWGQAWTRRVVRIRQAGSMLPAHSAGFDSSSFIWPYNKAWFFFFACPSRSINLKKKELGQYPAILTWSIKDYMALGKLFLAGHGG